MCRWSFDRGAWGAVHRRCARAEQRRRGEGARRGSEAPAIDATEPRRHYSEGVRTFPPTRDAEKTNKNSMLGIWLFLVHEGPAFPGARRPCFSWCCFAVWLVMEASALPGTCCDLPLGKGWEHDQLATGWLFSQAAIPALESFSL